MTHCKKTTIKLLIAVLVILALSTVLVACNTGSGPDHYDHLVTFVYNKGNLSGNTPNQQIGVFENSLVIIRPGFSSPAVDVDFSEATISGYYLEGWYLPDLDENGEIQKDENGFVKLGRKWNFNTDRVNQDITLYGNFKKKSAIRFVDKTTGKYIEGENEYIDGAPGDVIRIPTTSRQPRVAGYTFLGEYYKSKDSDEKFAWPYVMGEADIDVYVEFLKGEWALVETTSDFASAIRANQNIYLQNDLDFKNEGNITWGLSEYSGEINGRGKTVSNLSRELVASKVDSDANKDWFGGIFVSLGEKAYIHDITFENVSFTFVVNSSFRKVDAFVGLLAGQAAKGARIENVTLSGTLEYEPNNNHPIIASEFIGKNNIDQNDIKNCDFENVEIKQMQ